MRLVIQRVNSAAVTDSANNEIVGKIEKGLFILVGVKEGDTKADAEFLAEKLAKLRIMSDENDKMNLSVSDTKTSLLIVSQFTLYADTRGGNRPSFIKAAKPDLAKEIYEYFISKMREKGLRPGRPPAWKVETGKFGAYMNINTELDGPVTIIIESKE